MSAAVTNCSCDEAREFTAGPLPLRHLPDLVSTHL